MKDRSLDPVRKSAIIIGKHKKQALSANKEDGNFNVISDTKPRTFAKNFKELGKKSVNRETVR